MVISSCARTTIGPCVKGDMNNDGRIDGTDIQLFTDVIINPEGATDIMRCRADMNGDGAVNAADRDLFVCALLQKPGPCCHSLTFSGGGDGSGGEENGGMNQQSTNAPNGGAGAQI